MQENYAFLLNQNTLLMLFFSPVAVIGCLQILCISFKWYAPPALTSLMLLFTHFSTDDMFVSTHLSAIARLCMLWRGRFIVYCNSSPSCLCWTYYHVVPLRIINKKSTIIKNMTTKPPTKLTGTNWGNRAVDSTSAKKNADIAARKTCRQWSRISKNFQRTWCSTVRSDVTSDVVW